MIKVKKRIARIERMKNKIEKILRELVSIEKECSTCIYCDDKAGSPLAGYEGQCKKTNIYLKDLQRLCNAYTEAENKISDKLEKIKKGVQEIHDYYIKKIKKIMKSYIWNTMCPTNEGIADYIIQKLREEVK